MKKRTRKRPLAKLFTAFILLLAVSGALAFSIYNNRQQSLALNSAYLEYASVQMTEHLDDFLRNARTNLETVAYLYEQTLDAPEVQVEDLLMLANSSAPFDFMEFVALDGQGLFSSGETLDASDRTYYLEGISGKSGIDAVLSSTLTNETLIAFYAPIHYQEEILGVLVGMYQGSRLQTLLDTTFLGASTRNYLCLDDGTVFISSKGISDTGANVIDLMTRYVIRNDARAGEELLAGLEAAFSSPQTYTFTYPGSSGSGLGCLTMLSETGWHLLHTFPSNISNAVSDAAIYRDILLGAALMLFFSVYIAYLLIGYRKELTTRKEELSYWKQLFNLLTTNSTDIYVLFSPDTLRAEYVSPNLNQVLGLEPADVTKNVRNLFQTAIDGKSTLLQSRFAQIPSGSSWKTNRQMRHNHTGEIRWYQEALYHMEFNDSDSFVLILSDRTVEHRANVNLSQALEVARETNQSKSSFLSSVAHDIRTPMNAIMGFASLLEKNAASPDKVAQYARKITSSGQHLLSLIDDVLDMNKIENGKASINISQFDLETLLDDLHSIISPQADAKKQDFRIKTHGSIPKYLCGDRLRLEQILLNLLSNAVKYTQEGGAIELDLRRSDRQTGDGRVRLCFTVKDNGLGMSQEFLSSIYDPFAREATDATQKIQGTGLGMSIVKSFVDMMGGEIQVESRLGQGSTFTVDLGFDVPEQPLDKTFWEYHGISRILAVDDNPHVLAELQDAMKDTQVELTCTDNGQTAVEYVRQAHSQNRDFQIILLDGKLRGLSCIETARVIGQIMGQDPPIYILTGYHRKEIEEAAREIGVTRFLFKPFFLSSLRQAIAASETTSVSPVQEQEALPLQGRRFLAAEDNELNSEILLEILSLQGAQCELADNGRRALEMFESSAPGYYDAILMDVQMPIMNGYDASRAIRQCTHPFAESIPIIAMTANTFAEDVQNATDAGMNAHIGKPIHMEELCRVLNDLLNRPPDKG